MSTQTHSQDNPPDEPTVTIEETEELKLARKLQWRLRSVGIFVDKYEQQHRIRSAAEHHNTDLWRAAYTIEQNLLEEHNKTTDDMPIEKREMYDWRQHSDNPRIDDTIEGFWIPYDEEEHRREQIKQAENELINTEPEPTEDPLQDTITPTNETTTNTEPETDTGTNTDTDTSSEPTAVDVGTQKHGTPADVDTEISSGTRITARHKAIAAAITTIFVALIITLVVGVG